MYLHNQAHISININFFYIWNCFLYSVFSLSSKLFVLYIHRFLYSFQ
ncbi:hypothetical protein CoNPh17_CDS0018 [Staphylococcus phage S-CoN_Ph17]|nr:hypothetical protein CoNPh17_CDS0018 [Staphylococcus phage S-CoN_Ph17]